MWTNNLIKWTKVLFSGEAQTLVMVNGSESWIVSPYMMQAEHTLGNFMKKARCQDITVSISSYADCAGVYFGTGSTPANANDYKLDSPITSGLTITNPDNIIISKEADGIYTAEAAYLLRNTSDTEINIYEVGLIGLLCGKYSTASGSVYYRPCLLERQVLSAPITIAPGAIKLVEYKLTFNHSVS